MTHTVVDASPVNWTPVRKVQPSRYIDYRRIVMNERTPDLFSSARGMHNVSNLSVCVCVCVCVVCVCVCVCVWCVCVVCVCVVCVCVCGVCVCVCVCVCVFFESSTTTCWRICQREPQSLWTWMSNLITHRSEA